MSMASTQSTMGSLQSAAESYSEKALEYIQPIIVQGFLTMYQESLKQARMTNRITRRLAICQQLITKIPYWNTMIIEENVKNCNRDELETLIQGLIMIKTKIQSIMSDPDTKILMKVPTLLYVIHKCYIETGRLIYKNIDVVDTLVSPNQKMQNRRNLESLVRMGICKSIESFVPTVALLKKQSEMIADQLRTDLDIGSKNVEMTSLANVELGTATLPAIKDAPEITPEPEPTPEPQLVLNSEPQPVLNSEPEPQQTLNIKEETPKENTAVINDMTLKVESENKITPPTEEIISLQETSVEAINPTNMDIEKELQVETNNQEAPIQVNDMDSLNISLDVKIKDETKSERFE